MQRSIAGPRSNIALLAPGPVPWADAIEQRLEGGPCNDMPALHARKCVADHDH